MAKVKIMNKKAVVYFQSGGPTAVINSSLCGWLEEALKHDEIGEIYGARYGVLGLIHDDLISLRSLSEEDRKLMRQTPGAVTGSARLKLKDNKDGYYEAIEETVKKHNIGAIFVNGGNDSMDTCAKLGAFFRDKGVSVIGVPKTVDNDLMGMDHCPGFPSACRSVMSDVKAISVDCKAYEKGRVTIVETMGRDAGWIAASTALVDGGLAPDLVYLPEMKFEIDEFLANGRGARFDTGLDHMVVVSMGTGTSMVRVDGDDIRHIGGLGMGGGTLKGLAHLLLNTSDIATVAALAQDGETDKVNLKIEDVCDGDIVNLTGDATASLFAKVSQNNLTDNDLAAGLIHMVLETIGASAVLSQIDSGVKDFVLIGNIARLPQCREVFPALERLYNVNFHIPQYANYCTALGAALSYRYENE